MASTLRERPDVSDANRPMLPELIEAASWSLCADSHHYATKGGHHGSQLANDESEMM